MTLVDLRGGEGRDVRATTNATFRGPFLFSDDGARLAAGGSLGGVAGPRGATTGAVWLIDGATLAVSPLVQGLGREALPLDWSADGRFLLVQATEAQGRCAFHIVDTESGEAHPIAPAVTFCGANGSVIGWTMLA